MVITYKRLTRLSKFVFEQLPCYEQQNFKFKRFLIMKLFQNSIIVIRVAQDSLKEGTRQHVL
jgi:hypothetical protein